MYPGAFVVFDGVNVEACMPGRYVEVVCLFLYFGYVGGMDS